MSCTLSPCCNAVMYIEVTEPDPRKWWRCSECKRDIQLVDTANEITIRQPPPGDIIFYNDTDSEFCRITAEGKFVLNRERFPDATPDDFVKAFVELLEKTVIRHIDACPSCGWRRV